VIGGVAGPATPFGAPNTTRQGLYATTDGGSTWTKQTLPDPVFDVPNCGILQEFTNGVRFADAQNGWAAGMSICYEATSPYGQVARQGLVWTTGDGGATWTAHELSTAIEGLNNTLQAPSASQMRINGALLLDPFTAEEVLVTTDDTGGSFSYPVLPGPTSMPFDVHFTDANHGWMIARDGSVWRTADGGASWAQAGTLPQFRSASGTINTYTYTRIEASDPNQIKVVGSVTYSGSFLTAGFVERSTDGGATWTVVLLGDGS
jgi:photosystem II stability/assembly factor-like uncharacterized protein